jgi:hypothetical protein
MFNKKVYGASKTEKCPFCDRPAFNVNKQGIPVCQNHKDQSIDFRCICGEWLELKKSKWGVFFICANCGTISMHKALEMNSGIKSLNITGTMSEKKQEPMAEPKIRSAEKNYNDGIYATKNKSTECYNIKKDTYYRDVSNSNKKGRKETTIRSDDSFYFS